ncbi:MAG TPA: hypothetical protein VFA07_18330 [Chthonomonadaceae bacterium]|nr:hypothetical protein [Chthonomonadaceae bacterium]
MRLLRFDSEVGFFSERSARVIVSRIASTIGDTRISCLHFGPAGRYGYRRVLQSQLFLIVQGEGWVCDEEGEQVPLPAGQAAFWAAGEWYEAGTETSMTVMIVESEKLDPTEHMPELYLPRRFHGRSYHRQ